MKANNRHLLELIIATFLISTSGPLGRFINLEAPVIIWWRCFFALIALFVYCKVKKIDLKIKQKKDWAPIAISGIFTGLHWITYFYALKLSNVALGMLSLYTFPVIIALLEPLFNKSKFNPIHVLLAILVFIGIYILVPDFDMNNQDLVGILFGVVSALLFAIRILILKKHVKHYDGSMLMLHQLVIIVLLFSPIVVLMDSSNFNEVYPYLILLAVFTTAMGHTMLVKSLNHFSATTASIISSLQPIYGIIIAAFFLNEIPSTNTYIGGIIIIIAVVIETLRSRQKSK